MASVTETEGRRWDALAANDSCRPDARYASLRAASAAAADGRSDQANHNPAEHSSVQRNRPGTPLAFYSDRLGIFRVNAKDAESGDGKTEFGRVAERLEIGLINALTPQAKGRVERATRRCRTVW